MTRPRYTVVARRSGNWWALEAPEVRGASSQVKRLDQAEAMIRDAVAGVLDVDEDSFDISLAIHVADDVDPVLEGLAKRRREVEREMHEVLEAQADIARRLVRKHELSVRDSGWLLGLSHQRISQLVK